MLLRTRLTVYLSLAFLLVVGVLAVVGLRRESLLEGRLGSLAIIGQESVWTGVVTQTTTQLTSIAARMLGQMERRPPAESREQLRHWFDQAGRRLLDNNTVLQVTDRDGRLLFSSQGTFAADPMLDAASLDQIVATSKPVQGLQQTSSTNFMVLVAVPLERQGRTLGVATLARDANADLHRFAHEIKATAFLVSLRGRMVEGTSPMLWRLVQPRVPPRDPSFSTAKTDTRRFTVTGVPVYDTAGRVAGTLVSLRDSTSELEEIRTLGWLSLGLVAVFVILVLTALYFYLRRTFQPLEGAISVLKALSSGNTDVRLEAEGAGEIGRIADAVSVFRENTITLADQRRQSERQRRRQERLIRQQLTILASTLEKGEKGEALQDMQDLLDRGRRPAEEGQAVKPLDEDEQLGLLAQVLQSMSAQITDQHRRLTQMVAELQEAIVTKTKLAGLQQELEIARRLQYSILPKALPPSDGVEVTGCMDPAKEVGGDFYDFFFVEPGRLGLVIADVSGKGVPAALFMAISRSLLKATAQSLKDPGKSIDRINAVMADENDEMMFVTLFYGVLDLASGKLTFVNAGHNQPYLRHTDGGVRMVGTLGDVPLAVVEDFSFTVSTEQLTPGDVLLLYTDGVTESFNAAEEAYGEPRLEATLKGLKDNVGSAEVVDAVVRSVDDFVAGAPQSDDMTMLALKWSGPRAAGSDSESG